MHLSKVKGNEELTEPRTAIRPTGSRTPLCHSGLSAPLPPLTPAKPLILTLAKHAIKPRLPLFPQTPALLQRGGGRSQRRHSDLAKLSWLGLWGETWAKPCHRTQAGPASSPCTHWAKGSQGAWGQKNSGDDGVKWISWFYTERNWRHKGRFYFTTWIFMSAMCQKLRKMLRVLGFLSLAPLEEQTGSHVCGARDGHHLQPNPEQLWLSREPHVPNWKVPNRVAHTRSIHNMCTSSQVGKSLHKIFKFQMSYAFKITNVINYVKPLYSHFPVEVYSYSSHGSSVPASPRHYNCPSSH